MLGAYPTDSYFDPRRPQWLPFWIDTPSENLQKWGFYPDASPLSTALPNPPLPPAPRAYVDPITGSVSAETPQATQARYGASVTEFFSQVAQKPEIKATTTDWLILGGLLVGIVVLAR